MTVQVVTDSVTSLPSDIREELDIAVVSLHVHEGDREYLDLVMDVDEFYSRIGEMEEIPSSSQPSQEDFIATFAKAAADDRDVLGVFMSQWMSGTYEGALLAAKEVSKAYPEWKYRIVDSTSNSFDEAFPVISAARCAANGASLDECAVDAACVCNCTRFLFCPESLRFLHKGGRIGHAAALFGGLLKVTPILTVKNGFADTFAKVRTQTKALACMADTFKGEIDEYGFRNVAVHYIGSAKPAIRWAKEKIEPLVGAPVRIVPVSPVIGVHVGPAIGIVYETEIPLPGKSDRIPESVLEVS